MKKKEQEAPVSNETETTKPEKTILFYSQDRQFEFENGKLNGALKKDSSNNEQPYTLEEVQGEMRSFYKIKLQKLVNSENLLVLTGAGSSIGFGGVPMSGLMRESETLLTAEDATKFTMQDFKTKIGLGTSQNIEEILSKAKLFEDFATDETTKTKLGNTRKAIEGKIYELCNFNLDLSTATHLEFIKKLTKRKSKLPRAKIFTTNYDKAFEQAGAQNGSVIIDGFSFTSPRVFSGKYFDYDIVIRENSRVSSEENFAPNCFHLYKLHGSVTWYKDGEKVYQGDKATSDNAMMIYPNQTKYESSYEQPYFEMMGRFQSELRKRGTTTLIVIGFSFSDNHLFTMVNEALEQNHSLNLIIVDPSISHKLSDDYKNFKTLFDKANISKQLIFIGENFSDFVNNLPVSNYFDHEEANNAN